MTTDKFEELRSGLNDLFQNSPHREQPFQGFRDNDSSVAFCVAKDLLQDSHEGWLLLKTDQRPSSGSKAYIEFWGLLQAINIQQDALKVMHKSVTGERLPREITQNKAWTEIRDLRIRLSGHPVDAGNGVFRSSISRNFLSPTTALIETYDSKNDAFEHRFVSLVEYIECYYAVAVRALELIHQQMSIHWATENQPDA